MFRKFLPVLSCLVFSLLSMSHSRAEEFFWPSGSAVSPCGNTLQNCINQTVAFRGDTVTIVDSFDLGGTDGLTFINESITIDRDMTLRVAPFVEAIFVGLRSVAVQVQNGQSVVLRDLTFEQGGVSFNHNVVDSGFATYTAERLRFLDFYGFDGQRCAIQGRSQQLFPGAVGVFGRFIIKDNVIRVSNTGIGNPTGICLQGNRFAGDATPSVVTGNRIEGLPAAINSNGITVEMGSGAVRIDGNRISGTQTSIALVQENLTSLFDVVVKNNVMSLGSGTGIFVTIGDGMALVANNTMRCANNGFGGTGINAQNSFGVTAQIQLLNNLISDCVFGLRVTTATSVSNDHNLIHNASAVVDGQAVGPGTITANPQFESSDYLKPSDGSPAIDAGTSIAAVFTGFDADGNIRASGSSIDVGAFEMVSDRAFRETLNLNAVFAPLTASNAVLFPGDHPVATPMDGIFSATQLSQKYAIWLDGASWLLRHESFLEPLQVGRQFNVLIPRENADNFRHKVSSFNTTAGSTLTTLDHPSLNNEPNAIAIVTERFDREIGTGMEARALNLFYSEGSGRWRLSNDDNVSMVLGTEYDVMVGNTRSNLHFTVNTASAAPDIEIRHVFLDDNPCAVFAVGRVDNSFLGVFNTVPFVASYLPATANTPGRWRIRQPSGSNFPANAGYNIIIDGTATSRCALVASPQPDALFTNGFEAGLE